MQLGKSTGAQRKDYTQGFCPLQLFNDPHPPRPPKIKKLHLITSLLTIQTQANNVLYSAFYKNNHQINVVMLDSNGRISIHTLDFDQLQKYTSTRHRRSRNLSTASVLYEQAAARMSMSNISQKSKSPGNLFQSPSLTSDEFESEFGIPRSESTIQRSPEKKLKFSVPHPPMKKEKSSMLADDDSSSGYGMGIHKVPSINLYQNSSKASNNNLAFIPSSVSMSSMSPASNRDSIVSSYSFERLQAAALQASLDPRIQMGQSTSTPQIAPPPQTSTLIPRFEKIQITQKDGQFSLIGQNSLAIVDSGNVKLFNIQQRQISYIKVQSSDITSIFSNKSWTATSSKGSVLTLYHTNDLSNYVFSIPLYRDSIQCTYVSTTFDIAVCGTRDGFLYIVSLTRGTSGAAVDLKGARPYKVLVTPSWGFIVVYMTELERGLVRHVLSLYSPNGKFIRRRTIAQGIATWSAFKTSDGFDYIVSADDKGRLWMFEAFTLFLDESFHRCNGQVVSIMYSVEEGGCVAITKDGRILFVPNEVE